MRLRKLFYLCLAVLLCNAAPLSHAQDGEYVVGEFTIVLPWAAQTPAAPDSLMAFLVVQNPMTLDDKLISFSSDIAEEHIIIPASNYDPASGTPTISAPIGQTVFRPGNGFLQFKGLKTQLAPGSTFNATLTFYRVGSREVMFEVVSAQEAAVRLGVVVVNPNQPQAPATAQTAPPAATTPQQQQPSAPAAAQNGGGGGFSRADLFFSDQ